MFSNIGSKRIIYYPDIRLSDNKLSG